MDSLHILLFSLLFAIVVCMMAVVWITSKQLASSKNLVLKVPENVKDIQQTFGQRYSKDVLEIYLNFINNPNNWVYDNGHSWLKNIYSGIIISNSGDKDSFYLLRNKHDEIQNVNF